MAPVAARYSDRGTLPESPWLPPCSTRDTSYAAPTEAPDYGGTQKPEAAGGNESKTSAHQTAHATESSPLTPAASLHRMFLAKSWRGGRVCSGNPSRPLPGG